MFMQTPKETYLCLNILKAQIASTRTGHLFTCAVYPSLIQKLSKIDKNNNFRISKWYKKIENRGRKIQLVVFVNINVNCSANGLRDGRVLP